MGTLDESTSAAALALAMGLSIALVTDLGGPSGQGAHAPTSMASAHPSQNLAEQMEAQTAAGMPGVALALEQAAPPEQRVGLGVAIARVRAQFELGDAPRALSSAKDALRNCDNPTAATAPEKPALACSPGEKAQLTWLETILEAVVSAGIVDVRSDPSRAGAVVRQLVRPARMDIPSDGDAPAGRRD